MAWNGPPPGYSQHPQGQNPFWDFIRAMDRDRTGSGIDHVNQPSSDPSGPGDHRRSTEGPSGPWGPWSAAGPEGGWAGPWGGYGFGSWGGGGGRGSWRRRNRDDAFNFWGAHAEDDEAGQAAAAGATTAAEKNNGDGDVNMEGDADGEKQQEKARDGNDEEKDRDDSPGTVRDSPAEGPSAGAAAPAAGECGSDHPNPRGGCGGRSHSRRDHHPHPHPPRGFGCGRGRGAFGRGGGGPFGFGFGGRAGPHHGYFGGGIFGPRDGPPQPPFAFDLGQLGQMLAAVSQRIPQNVRDNVQEQIARTVAAVRAAAAAAAAAPGTNNNDGGNDRYTDNNNDDDYVESFTPPADVFDTGAPSGPWVVHVALPGAKREDLGVHWDAERGVLAISGVVYRPGDEAFLSGMVSGERKVGLFRREVRLPPQQKQGREGSGNNKEEVDPEGIAARLEDGVLVVTVPRVEKEWTEIRKVDVQ